MDIVSFEKVTKSYKNNGVVALKNVTFKIESSQIIGLIGRNGAGKTTLINILMGFIPQTSGNVLVFNQKPGKANRQIGYVPDFPHFHQKETAFSLLMALAKMRKIEHKKQRQRCLEVIEKFELNSFAHRKLCQLSKGMLQRFNIAQGMLSDPDLVVMDEPLSSLDPFGQSEIIDFILKLRRPGRTMLISSHLLFHLEKICDQVLVLDKGITKFFDKPNSYLNETTTIKFSKPLTDLHIQDFASLGVKLLNKKEIEIDHRGDNIYHLLRYCADQKLEIESLARNKGSLEDLFLSLVKDE